MVYDDNVSKPYCVYFTVKCKPLDKVKTNFHIQTDQHDYIKWVMNHLLQSAIVHHIAILIN